MGRYLEEAVRGECKRAAEIQARPCSQSYRDIQAATVRILQLIRACTVPWACPGSGELQVRHSAEGDEGAAGVEAATLSWHAHHRSDEGAEAEDHQQGGLGESVSQH